MDTFWVMGRRLLSRKNPFVPDKTHLHHRLLRIGFSHLHAVRILWGISLFWGLMALFLWNSPEYLALGLFLVFSLVRYGVVKGLLKLKKIRFLEDLFGRDNSAGIVKECLY